MLQLAARRFMLSQSSHGIRTSSVAGKMFYQTLSKTSPISSTRDHKAIAYFSSYAKEDAPAPPPETPIDHAAAQARALKGVKKQLWEFYLSTGRGANALFEAIDLDENGAVSPEDLMEFVEEVMESMLDEEHPHPRDIMPYAWNRLEQRAKAGQQYDIKHFKKWLVAATKMSADMKNSRLMAYLKSNPSTGDLFQNRLPHQFDDPDDDDETAVYTWNEESMSQSLRRMQYAVRGEVAMLADKLVAEGRDIIYTNIGKILSVFFFVGSAFRLFRRLQFIHTSNL